MIACQAEGIHVGEVIAKQAEDACFVRVDNRVTEVPLSKLMSISITKLLVAVQQTVDAAAPGENNHKTPTTLREVLSIELAVPISFRWSEVPITFSSADQWRSFSEPGCFPLILKPVVTGSRLNKVLIDGGSDLNVLFTKTLKKMKLGIPTCSLRAHRLSMALSLGTRLFH
jgi:hypothetical protein